MPKTKKGACMRTHIHNTLEMRRLEETLEDMILKCRQRWHTWLLLLKIGCGQWSDAHTSTMVIAFCLVSCMNVVYHWLTTFGLWVNECFRFLKHVSSFLVCALVSHYVMDVFVNTNNSLSLPLFLSARLLIHSIKIAFPWKTQARQLICHPVV